MSVPKMPLTLMSKVYLKVFPVVHQELNYWTQRAQNIPNSELRKQALASIKSKTFHCEGGSIMALIAMSKYKEVIKFIVAYQTISDYLDNLCDRSTSLDPKDFSALHESMEHALTVGAEPSNYYRYREDQDDGGYLYDLAKTCRDILNKLENYSSIKEQLLELCRYYCDLQIHKHVIMEERIPRLKFWFEKNKNHVPKMEWYEFSACSGSTLGIFCLVSYAFRDDFDDSYPALIRDGYFPYIQGLHILLDYFIDQEEDKIGGDLNFCFYYENEEELFNRLKHFVTEADRHTNKLPHQKFHKLINRGLLGVYLSDEKVYKQRNIRKLAKNMIRTSGPIGYFFYLNGRAYRKFQKVVPASALRALSK
ncbi:tetraprenyl-beta-curcumene synthase family protein [Cytobacillus oceanisediminis]|uniref:Tetraprenyl-beta-curcumene synthase family protein n=1 Tax=Niallia alba TaxID=2729105 RepID=A0A7Y0PN99_9BACI|nr:MULTISPECIES: tetraprenyl-beta-curcumene synthase family protein [Bacillaceae]MBZ9536058.1 tetraprenyl-beta-curcumene synthase family protein [Cytobacillus oceanisediminis]NMO78873.1 tetraprenyl-beta-curcumene synthase family protein [Niallia alba]